MTSVRRFTHQLHRRILIHRRGLAAVLLGLASWWILQAWSTPGPTTVSIWTANHDLPSGTVLGPADLRRTEFLPDSVPPRALGGPTAVGLLGRVLAGPVSTGQTLTDADLVGPGLLRGLPGRVATTIRLPDPAVAELLRVGDRVAVLASDPQRDQPARQVVGDAVVLAIGQSPARSTPGEDGRLVLLAVPEASVEEVAAASAALYLSVIWNR